MKAIIRIVPYLLKLGIAFFAALSLVRLIEYASNLSFDFKGILPDIAAAWDDLLSRLEAKLTPLIGPIYKQLYNWFGWQLILQPHWKYICALLGSYFVGDITTAFLRRHFDVVLVSAVAGALSATTAGVVAGSIPLSHHNPWDNLVIVAAPALAFFFYIFSATLANAWWHRREFAEYAGHPVEPFWRFLWTRSARNFRNTILALTVSACFLWIEPLADTPLLRDADSPGLVLLAILFLILSGYWLWRGGQQARKRVLAGKPAWDAIMESGNIQMSIAMILPFLWTVVLWIAFDLLL